MFVRFCRDWQQSNKANTKRIGGGDAIAGTNHERLIEWIYEMVVGIMEYAAKELVGVMSMDMAYFEQTAPVIKDITNIILALGWGMLIANMVFQSTKAMMSGVGFESEDPKHIFCRTFVFAFLLLASKQICNLAMGITENVIELLQIPSALDFSIPDQSMFDISSSVKWLIVIVVGFILIFQYIKLLFEIGERYVVTSVLTFFHRLHLQWAVVKIQTTSSRVGVECMAQ